MSSCIAEDSILDFYPRPPRGGRLSSCIAEDSILDFYPRPPRGGRLLLLVFGFLNVHISTHALREEGDVYEVEEVCNHYEISTHALREEGDGGEQLYG